MKTNVFASLMVMSLLSLASCDYVDDFTGGPAEEPKAEQPLIIAHRGAQSVFPEHTLEAYAKGVELGADYIEPDLVLTKDGVLVARHEPMLSGTTNVADLPEFADRKTTKNVDGKEVTDWFASDFTLEEIKQLRAVQVWPNRPHDYDGKFQIPTFSEIIALAKSKTTASGNKVGIYPEIKHPYFHNQLGFAMEDALLQELDKAGWNHYDAPVFVQCFEVAPLQYINTKSTVKLVQLISTYDVNADGSLVFDVPAGDFISYAAPYDFYVDGDSRTYEYFSTEEGMLFTASYADGIGPWKPFIISFTKDVNGNVDKVLPPSDFIDLAHKYGLKVHPYTFRNEDEKWSGGNPEAEYHLFFDAGVDGVFTDYTDDAVRALESWKK
ncbi:glycerophosphodiester phosphodiesterase [Croceivirga sp. JEA036]|uniref:glycerophosphodiester phosphodiesterase n=1 Tax=Croceivirga sp. JEA036 TaxID=2721162 RepID=UPI0014392A6E|nr:glycerophosphodiester phosphodiesterase [Croceivirga sp. JEA036]NJB37432.1 glycerophosphodiester phosphodiesterase [Croceivirga sp. JEA036]